MPKHHATARHTGQLSPSQHTLARSRSADCKRRIKRMLDQHGVPFSIKQQCLRILDQLDERKASLLEARLKDFF